MKQAHRELVQRWWDELERLSRILGRVGPDEMCCEGLTQRQCAILRILVAQEGARLSDLAASVGISPSAMTRVLERLEARGLVERVRGSQPDGRATVVRISAAGRRTRRLLDELMRQRTSQIIRAVSANRRTQVLKALETLNDVIEAFEFCGLNTPVNKLAKAGRLQRTRS
jgi:DNA-binding MarR family transcriptional regulator